MGSRRSIRNCMFTSICRGVVSAVFMICGAGLAGAAGGGLALHVRPHGPVAGDIRVTVDLGVDGGPAELFLDGAPVCTLSPAAPECVVDLGDNLHVHLLELVRETPSGGRELAERWLNRPGRETELSIELAAHPIGNLCGGRLSWRDDGDWGVVTLAVEASGERTAVSPEERIFAYPCADEGSTEIVASSIHLADGRRAVTSVVADAQGRPTGEAVEPVVLDVRSTYGDACRMLASETGAELRADRYQGLDVAFVLDPGADFHSLSGLSAPSAAASDSWREITALFADADGLWFVTPDDRLDRIDGFAAGRAEWLGRFFQLGQAAPSGRLRVADAVAAGGLVAGAAPHRRAVVLVLGASAIQDDGRFTPAQVRSYLAEIGVPLFVVRTVAGAADGWPEGRRAGSLTELEAVIEAIWDDLDRQCGMWFPAGRPPETIAASLPRSLVIAGRDAVEPASVQRVWRRAELIHTPADQLPVTDRPVASEQVEVTAVSVLIRTHDANGHPVTDLTTGDVVVTEDGRGVPVLAVEPLPQMRMEPGAAPEPAASRAADEAPTRKTVPVAVYVERRLAGTPDLAPALSALAERADWLTTLGPVDIVVADRTVEPYLEGASDPAVVRDALEKLATLPSTEHAVERIRKNYVRLLRGYPERGRAREGGEIETSTPSNIVRTKTMTYARSSIFEEDALLRRTMSRMNDWALGLPASGPRLLFLVGTGFDEDPIDFYTYFIGLKDPSLTPAARAEFLRYNQATHVESVGRELAAAGWLVVPVATSVAGSLRTTAEFGGGEKFQAFLTDSQQEGVADRDVDFMLLDPLGSQQHLAEPSGGEVVMGAAGLDRLIRESSGWYRVTYQVDRAPDGALHETAVTAARLGVAIESSEVVVSGTSEGRSEMRLRRLLDDPSQGGELPVRVEVGAPRPADEKEIVADLAVIVDLGPIAPLLAEDGRRMLRFSLAVAGAAGGPSIAHRLAAVVGAVPGIRFELPVQWKKKLSSRVAVVVEDLASGAWGGTVTTLGD